MNARTRGCRQLLMLSINLMPLMLLSTSGCSLYTNIDLYQAIESGDKAKALKLIAKGRPVNKLIGGYVNRTVLFEAASRGQDEVVTALLMAGADPQVENGDCYGHAHKVPLHNAQAGSAKLLLAAGAKVDARDNQGNTPLMCAAEGHKLDAIRLLLDHGANVNAQNAEGSSALMAALSFGDDVNTVDELVRRGAGVDIRDKQERTALMHAASSLAPNTMTALIGHHANVRTKTKEGVTPLMLVCQQTGAMSQKFAANERKRILECAQILVAGGVDIHARTADHSWTALHFAASNDLVEVADYLIDLGVEGLPVSSPGDGAYATAVSSKLLARHSEARGDMELAASYYRVAADHYEKAVVFCDQCVRWCDARKSDAILANLAGLAVGAAVTGTVAQANYNATGSTYTGTLGMGGGAVSTEGLSLVKADFERKREECKKCAGACRQMVECLDKGLSAPDTARRIEAAKRTLGLL